MFVSNALNLSLNGVECDRDFLYYRKCLIDGYVKLQHSFNSVTFYLENFRFSQNVELNALANIQRLQYSSFFWQKLVREAMSIRSNELHEQRAVEHLIYVSRIGEANAMHLSYYEKQAINNKYFWTQMHFCENNFENYNDLRTAMVLSTEQENSIALDHPINPFDFVLIYSDMKQVLTNIYEAIEEKRNAVFNLKSRIRQDDVFIEIWEKMVVDEFTNSDAKKFSQLYPKYSDFFEDFVVLVQNDLDAKEKFSQSHYHDIYEDVVYYQLENFNSDVNDLLDGENIFEMDD